MIEAVIFDWGGVLIDNPVYGFARYCARRLKVSRRNFGKAYRVFRSDFQRGAITEHDLWKKICSELKIKEPESKSLWEDAFRANYREKKEVLQIAENLYKQRCKTAVLSNTEMPTLNCFSEKGYNFFDAAIFSCLEGTRKPEQRIYKIALERLEVMPYETIIIDNIATYLEPARNLGMKTILFENKHKLKERLESYLSF